MKKLILILMYALPFIVACGNPYADPETSKALSLKEQVELLKEQNKQLKRIADALEKETKKDSVYNRSNKSERTFEIQR